MPGSYIKWSIIMALAVAVNYGYCIEAFDPRLVDLGCTLEISDGTEQQSLFNN